jgi:hypothetical protein
MCQENYKILTNWVDRPKTWVAAFSPVVPIQVLEDPPSMLEQLVSMLPDEIGTAALVLAMIAALAGVGLWLIGAKFSRGLITLALVSTGASIGMNLPGWFGWGIAGWATGMLGALVLGVSGYAMHRFWVGVGLGLVLMCWAALATWTFGHGSERWAWPDVTPATTAGTFFSELWDNLPDDVRRILPFSCGAALISGIAATILWPRIGIVVLYSLMGVSLLISMALLAMESGQPQWLGLLPRTWWAQLLCVMLMVGIGATVQWKLGLAGGSGGGGGGGAPKPAAKGSRGKG